MMKNNKKGFTLIKLLAVIFILALIVIISVLVVLNILNKDRKLSEQDTDIFDKVKESAAIDAAHAVLNDVKLYYAEAVLDNPTDTFKQTTFTFNSNGNVKISPASTAEFKVKGTKPTAGVVTLTSDGTVSITTNLVIKGFSCSQPGGANSQVKCKQ